METITRNTKETQIQASLEVYGKGIAKIQTGIGFFNHMLESLCKHAYWDLTLECKGDLEVDYHHSVEDCGIVIGELLKKNLFPIQKIERFGNSAVVMDESCVECDLDISNRPFLVFEVDLKGKVGGFDCELVEEFFRALVFNAGLSTHLTQKRGKNQHHLIEATFKAFGVALRRACVKNDTIEIPSTKGIL
ncbi:imidazoleglycerol-phosphate dehydratase [Helicobacter pullorum]|uniref:imidazoleglycerol-phosphate dehydratase HisB n=1 Tax=Helicobacter pullorum TaxID=35818 RepID=UPI0008168E5C|nr:imidazoleglycerol-phosphate dehydratase HisB [Helicobacter pullorum]OCR03814.1 imidazoleglycerol-phosphate dehydratase [Helicobacter pullorum]OCR07642.1 imidazoleglycerol-phosphate dehydratase [Helicobacter pullorum]OCR10874.1 imidazoleglycerol-phosphate dehydratase [Helicobacter pullorum]OCR13368.1 imidazoleglycerol-phosphate dehydratase [Helicobacter pullorum]